MITASSLESFESKRRATGRRIIKFIIIRSFFAKTESTTTLPEVIAISPVISVRSTIVAPIVLPKDNCGVLSSAEFMPTKNSGVDVAKPKTKKETTNVLSRIAFAVLIKFFTTRSADLARTIRLTNKTANVVTTDITPMVL